MDADTTLVIGLVVSVLAVPAIVSAFSEGKAPRAATIALVIGLGLVVYAISVRQYSLDQLPEVIFRVINRFLG